MSYILANWHRNSVDKRTLIENYDLASLCIDEIIDDGIILETDPVIIASRVRPAASARYAEHAGY